MRVHSLTLSSVWKCVQVPELTHAVLGASDIIRFIKLDLRYSEDWGNTHLAMEMTFPHSHHSHSPASNQMKDKFWNPVVLGIMYYVEIEIPPSDTHPLSQLTPECPPPTMIHRVGVGLTRQHQFTVFQHYSYPSESSNECHVWAPTDPPTPVDLSLMTFNVWNVNPPAYLFRDAQVVPMC